mmetsp:Transcript_2120/g.4976  ORF Transcript_2120/g.4976 Transcript_2120/m.4976 type:complete len:120 (-) Transcript_2120:234-593(-)
MPCPAIHTRLTQALALPGHRSGRQDRYAIPSAVLHNHDLTDPALTLCMRCAQPDDDSSSSSSDSTALIAGVAGGVGGAVLLVGGAMLFMRSKRGGSTQEIETVHAVDVNDLKAQLADDA